MRNVLGNKDKKQLVNQLVPISFFLILKVLERQGRQTHLDKVIKVVIKIKVMSGLDFLLMLLESGMFDFFGKKRDGEITSSGNSQFTGNLQ